MYQLNPLTVAAATHSSFCFFLWPCNISKYGICYEWICPLSICPCVHLSQFRILKYALHRMIEGCF